MDDSFEKTIKIVLVILVFAFSFGTPAVRWVIVGTIVLSALFLALLIYFGNLALERKEEKARVIAEKYPYAFQKYKRDHNLKAQISDWESKDRKEFFSWEEKEWELLQQEEEKRIALEKTRIEQINEKYRSIESAAPNGLNNWISKNNFCLSSKVMKHEIKHLPETNSKGQKIITKEDVIANKSIILQYEDAIRHREQFSDWNSSQIEFSSEFNQLSKGKLLKVCELSKIKINYILPDIAIEEVNVDFIVHHYFFHSFCLDKSLDYSLLPSIKSYSNYIENDFASPELLSGTASDTCYYRLGEFFYLIFKSGELTNCSLVFCDDVEIVKKDHFSKQYEAYIVRNAIAKMARKLGLFCYHLSDVLSGNAPELGKRIIIIGHVAYLSDMLEQCKQILISRKGSHPNIVYISVYKELSSQAMQSLLDKKKKTIVEGEEKKSKEQEVSPAKDINPARAVVIHKKKEEGSSGCDVIISKPNPKQVDDLRIRYTPSDAFNSPDIYPVVTTPAPNSLLKLPRQGRSDIRGYKEPEFLAQLHASLTGICISDNFHLRIPGRYAPYEPDIVLFDEEINLYIDVEIDEPYDGYNRLVTHITEGSDAIRDVFFKESGWVVVRFSEKQVHFYSGECIRMLENIIAVMRGEALPTSTLIEKEPRWDRRQAIEWEKELYREKYLGIQFFSRQNRSRKIICLDKPEGIDLMIVRTPVHTPIQIEELPFFKQPKKADPHPLPPQKTPVLPDLVKATPLEVRKPTELCFDEHSHSYYNPCDMTGNSDRISVTTLIERFFPHFDEEAYIKKRMEEAGMTEDEVRRELAEPSERGTDMHKQIENYLKGLPYDGSSREFQFFLRFHEEQIVRRGLTFDSAEYPIELKGSNIAGTVDALFRKPDGNYVMVDWKRSKHLIIDGYPKKYGFGCGLSVLSHLDNSSYYKYELQQSFYKYILEKDYDIRVSSMILAVLYPEYDRYYTVKLSQYRRQEVLDMIESYESTL